MKGFLKIDFQGLTGKSGSGFLVVYSGMVSGFDRGAGRYAGVCYFNPHTGHNDYRVNVTIPANMEAVQGFIKPYDWSFDTEFSLPAIFKEYTRVVETPVGPVLLKVTYLGKLQPVSIQAPTAHH